MARFLSCVITFILITTGSASADVTYCNKTPYNLSFAVAAEVTDPYATWEVAGWFNIDAGSCRTTFTGDYTGRKVYYFAYVEGDRDVSWERIGNLDTYTLCIPSDTSLFDRKGSASDLQPPCKSGWKSEKFYCMGIGSKDYTHSFWLASDPNLPADVKKNEGSSSDGCS